MKRPALRDLGEFGFIARMARPFLDGLPKGVRGIGDDCAVLPWTKSESLIVTTDMLIEDRHFIRKRMAARDLGYKALAVNLSDIAAMGGRPKWALLSIGIPEGVGLDWLDDFYRGWREAARPSDVRLIGGDTTQSPDKIVINVVVGGTVRVGRAKLRSAARAGDVVAVTGKLGDSGGGLKVLLGEGGESMRGGGGATNSGTVERGAAGDGGTHVGAVGTGAAGGATTGDIKAGKGNVGCRAAGGVVSGDGAAGISTARNGEAGDDETINCGFTRDEVWLVRAHHRPRPHLEEGEWLGRRAGIRAMMDVSDGIDSDIRRIMEQSGVGARIELEKLPVSAELVRVAERRGFDPVETAAAGGEDYCLLVTVKEAEFAAVAAAFKRRFRRPLYAVGEIRPKSHGLRYFRGAREVALSSRGFDHFNR